MKIEQKIPNPVSWPAMIKHDMDAGIDYIESQVEWNLEFSQAIYMAEDVLIDRLGRCFNIVSEQGGAEQLQPIDRIINNKELTQWIREYAAQQGQCCISKLHIRSIQDALDFVKDLDG